MERFYLKFWLRPLMVATLLVCCADGAYAQQLSSFTHYMFNGLAINPAYAGSHDGLDATFVFRQQWAGLEGAPQTQSLSAHTSIGNKWGKRGRRNNNNGSIGFTVLNDKIGVTRETGFNGIYAYRVPLKGDRASSGIFKNLAISFGVNAGFSSWRLALSDLRQDAQLGAAPDPRLAQDNISSLLFNFGAGVYLYADRFFLGLSAPLLITNSFEKNKVENLNVEQAQQTRHFFLYSGVVLPISANLKFKPSVLVKAVSGAPLSYDVNANFLIKERFWVGASYRSEESIDFIIQAIFSDKIRVGYSYDLGLGSYRSIHNGSHEFSLNFFLSPDTEVVRINPRYF